MRFFLLYSIFDTDTSFSRNPATLRTTLTFVIATVSGGKYRTRYRFQRRRDVVVAALNKSTNYSLHSATIGSVLFSTRPTSGTYSEPVCGLSFTARGNVFTDAYQSRLDRFPIFLANLSRKISQSDSIHSIGRLESINVSVDGLRNARDTYTI